MRTEALVVEAALDVDGEERACPAIAVHVRGREAFARAACRVGVSRRCLRRRIRRGAFDARRYRTVPRRRPCRRNCSRPRDAIETPRVAHAADDAFAGDAFTFGLRIDGERLDEVARLLSGASGRGLIPHVLALRVFFPDIGPSDDPVIAAALDDVRCALRDVFDRLFVKLRIPGFGVAADDVDDVTLRGAMTSLFRAAARRAGR